MLLEVVGLCEQPLEQPGGSAHATRQIGKHFKELLITRNDPAKQQTILPV
jgi:hypothetical protein